MIDFEELREKISNAEVKNGNIIGCVANYIGTPVMDAIMETIAAELNNDKLEYTIVSTGVADGYGDQLCEKVNKMIMNRIILQLNSEQYNLLKDMVEDYLNEVSNIVFIAPSDKLAKKRLKQLEDLRKIIF